MAVILPSEQSNIPLSLAQAEGLWTGFYRASVLVTISADTLTVPGSGRYRVNPQTGTSDQITAISLSAENVDGAEIELRPNTVGHTITLIHGGNLHLANGINAELTTIYSTITLRHYGGGVWAATGPALYVP